MKTVAVFLLGLLCGAAVVWWLVPGRYHHLYQTTGPLTLTHQGRVIGVLPKGSPLLTNVELTRTPDLGWWGFAPVLFDDMWRAQDLGGSAMGWE